MYAERKVNRVFTPTLFVSFRSGYSLRKHLVRARVYPLFRERGRFCCWKRRCETCCNIKQMDTFERLVTKKVYKINHYFNCNSKCLIYLFSCKVSGIQHVVSTVDRFRFRWNNYKSYQSNAADGGTPNQNFLHEHFLSDGHNWLMNDWNYFHRQNGFLGSWKVILLRYDYQFLSTTYLHLAMCHVMPCYATVGILSLLLPL